MLRYAILTIKRSTRRAMLTIAGLSLAFAAIIFAYAIASRVDGIASRALLFVVGNANVWFSSDITPFIDPELGNIVSSKPLEESLVKYVTNAAPGQFYRIAVCAVTVGTVKITLYADERDASPSLRGLISADLAMLLGTNIADINIQETVVPIAGVRPDLPGVSVVVPYSLGKRLLDNTNRVDWLVGRVVTPKLWLEQLSTSQSIAVADSPVPREMATGKQSVAYLLEGSRSRIDPYSFRTKFSAYTYNRALATVIGWTARVVFGFGVVLAASSMTVSVKERRAEVAIFTVLGLQSEFTTLLLAEMLLFLIVVVPTGVALATVAVALTVPSGDFTTCVLPALALSVFFLPIAAFVAALCGGQAIASQSELELVRGAP